MTSRRYTDVVRPLGERAFRAAPFLLAAGFVGSPRVRFRGTNSTAQSRILEASARGAVRRFGAENPDVRSLTVAALSTLRCTAQPLVALVFHG